MVRHYNSFGGLGLIDRISQESHTSLMLLVELVKSQRLSVEKNPMEICYSILSGKGILQGDSRPQGGKNKLYVLKVDHAIVVHVHIGFDGENLSVRQGRYVVVLVEFMVARYDKYLFEIIRHIIPEWV